MTHAELAKLIADVSLLHGEFTLRSGRKSNYYLDKYRFETDPVVLRELGKLFAAHVTPDVVRIAGAELGAVPLATAASMASGKPSLLVRNQKKDYGTSKQVEGILNAGDKLLVVEDVVTSGGQVLEVCNVLKGLGAEIVKIVAVIDRQEGGREAIEKAGYRFESLFTVDQLGVNTKSPATTSAVGGASHV